MSEEDPKKSVADSLRDWGIDVDRLGVRAKESLHAAKGDLSEIAGTLQQTLVHAKDVVTGLHATGSPAATELKAGFERAWAEIEKAFRSAREKAKGEPPASPNDEPPPPSDDPAI